MARTHKLKRNLGLFLITLFALGNIVGAGIYSLIGKVAGESGLSTPLAFIIAMFIASFSALSFAELTSRRPYSEGVSAYVHSAFKRKRASLIVGLLMSAATIVSAATLARAFGGYLNSATGLAIPIASTLVIAAFGILAFIGIEESLKFSAAHTIIEIIGLLAIVWFGRAVFSDLPTKLGQIFDLSTVGIGGVMTGAFLAFYAYIGIEDAVHLSEETKKTRVTMPRAIVLSIVISTVLYILISVVAVFSIPVDQLSSSNAPLSLVFSKVANSPAWIITIVALTATAGGVLAHVLSGSRLLYGMAEAGWINKRLAVVHEKRKTPALAIIFVVVIASVLAIFLDLTFLAATTSYLILFIFSLVNLSLIIIKLSKKNKNKPGQEKNIFKVSIIIPILGLLFSLVLLTSESINLLSRLF
jgi:amino acid transporter